MSVCLLLFAKELKGFGQTLKFSGNVDSCTRNSDLILVVIWINNWI